MHKYPRCNEIVTVLAGTPPGSLFAYACKPCAKFMWAMYDREQGLDLDNLTKARASYVPNRQPTNRHAIIAGIARDLGANVNENDVKLVFAAERIEYEERTGKFASGGVARAKAMI
jgi:hypothetical protein